MYAISVVIPVYNVEKTLKRCMDSVLKQDFDDYEIILVDDGSTDGSSQMCEEYARLDNVNVVHKVNGGLGSARNAGIEKAVGEYICFVDSDDWIEKNYLSIMYAAMKKNKADICICGYYYHINKNIKKVCPETAKKLGKDIYSELGMGNSIYNFAWNKLYRLDVIKERKLEFFNRHCAEDMMFNCQYFKYIGTGCVVSSELYHYEVNYNSLSNGRREGFLKDMMKVHAEYLIGCSKFHVDKEIQNGLAIVLIRNSLSNFYNNSRTPLSAGKRYMLVCKNAFDIEGLESDIGKLAKVDYLIFKLLKYNHFICLHLIMRLSKMFKSNLSFIYSIVRNTVSGNKSKS